MASQFTDHWQRDNLLACPICLEQNLMPMPFGPQFTTDKWRCSRGHEFEQDEPLIFLFRTTTHPAT